MFILSPNHVRKTQRMHKCHICLCSLIVNSFQIGHQSIFDHSCTCSSSHDALTSSIYLANEIHVCMLRIPYLSQTHHKNNKGISPRIGVPQNQQPMVLLKQETHYINNPARHPDLHLMSIPGGKQPPTLIPMFEPAAMNTSC